MIDLDLAKQHLAVEHDSHDGLISGYIAAAVALVEAETDRFLEAKEYTQALAGFSGDASGEVRLFKGPVTEIGTIAYDPSDGEAEIGIADYRLVEGERAILLPAYGDTWPATLDGAGTVRVTYTAGYAEGEAPMLDQACLMLVAHWYANREAVSAGPVNEVPMAVAALLKPYRPKGLA